MKIQHSTPDYQKKRYAKRKSLGLCPRCPNKLVDNKCLSCNAKLRPGRKQYQVKRRAKVSHKDLKHFCVAYLGGKCSSCGLISEHSDVYDFHHVDRSTKTATIARLISIRVPENVLKLELDKCVLFCANCHRIHHSVVGYRY